MRNLEDRDIVNNPEDNENIQALLKLMGDVLTSWYQTSFKAIPKDTVSTHNIKW